MSDEPVKRIAPFFAILLSSLKLRTFRSWSSFICCTESSCNLVLNSASFIFKIFLLSYLPRSVEKQSKAGSVRFRRIFTIRILHVCLLIFSKVPDHLPVLHLSAFRCFILVPSGSGWMPDRIPDCAITCCNLRCQRNQPSVLRRRSVRRRYPA